MSKYDFCNRCEKDAMTEEHCDARGIYITRCCDACWKEVSKGYRPEVLDDPGYQCDEQIEEEEY